jgi:hypothetical protein
MPGVKGRSGGRRKGAGRKSQFTLEEKLANGKRLTATEKAEAIGKGLIPVTSSRPNYVRRNSVGRKLVTAPGPITQQQQEQGKDCMEDRAWFFSAEHDIWTCPFCIRGLGEYE